MSRSEKSTHKLAPDYCPNCKKTVDAHSSADPTHEIPPKTGDITICMYCGVICQLDEDMRLEKAPDEVLKEIQRKHPIGWFKMQYSIKLIKEHGQSRTAQ